MLLPSSPLCLSVWLGILSRFMIIMIGFSGGGAWTTVLILKVKVFARKPELHWPALLWFLSAVVSDVMITVVLVITLVSMLSVIVSKITKCAEYKNKRKTGYTATDDVISKIIRGELRLLDWWEGLDCLSSQRLFRRACWRMLLIFHVLTSPSEAKPGSALFAIGDVIFFMSEYSYSSDTIRPLITVFSALPVRFSDFIVV